MCVQHSPQELYQGMVQKNELELAKDTVLLLERAYLA